MAVAPGNGRRVLGVAGPQVPRSPEGEETTRLYERHAAEIFRFCLRRLGSWEEAEDAVQGAFLNAFRGLQRGIVPEAESAWLYKIAENVCLTRKRSSRRRGRVETPAEARTLEDLAAAPEGVSGDELVRLQHALESLPEAQRRAILLREWQGLSYREIGERLDLSDEAVAALISRARSGLVRGLEHAPRVWKGGRRVRRALDAGWLLPAARLLPGGSSAGGAAAVAAAVAVVVLPSAPEASPSGEPVEAAAPPRALIVEQHRARPLAEEPAAQARVVPAPRVRAIPARVEARTPRPPAPARRVETATQPARAPAPVRARTAPPAAEAPAPVARAEAQGPIVPIAREVHDLVSEQIGQVPEVPPLPSLVEAVPPPTEIVPELPEVVVAPAPDPPSPVTALPALGR